MTKEEAINYIENFGWSTTRLGLERTFELLERIGNPQKKLKFIHVAGSNGKGSTCAMFDSILRGAGFRTGLYISPYIQDFCERMQVNGKNISGTDLARITEIVKDAAEKMDDHPSQFELVTAIAMEYFYEQQCEIVVLEVGMGGALDSTNVIDAPELACITNIGLEHTEYLGNTLEKIAKTKAGIIKPGCSCVCYDGAPKVTKVVKDICAELDVPLSCVDFSRMRKTDNTLYSQTDTCYISEPVNVEEINDAHVDESIITKNIFDDAEIKQNNAFAVAETDESNKKFDINIYNRLNGQNFLWYQSLNDVYDLNKKVNESKYCRVLSEPSIAEQNVKEYSLSLLGTHQLHNAALVLTGIEMLKKKGWNISDEAIEKGLKNVKWPARFEVLSREPIVILDGGHNPQCAKAMTESLKNIFPGKKVTFLVGVLRDKDYDEITDMLIPFAKEFVCVTPISPRALTGDELCEYLTNKGVKACACETTEDGILTALNKTVVESNCRIICHSQSTKEQKIISEGKPHSTDFNKIDLLDAEDRLINVQINDKMCFSAKEKEIHPGYGGVFAELSENCISSRDKANLKNTDFEGYMENNPNQRFETADENIIVVFGSLYLAGEARTLFHKTYRKWLRKTKIAARDGIPPEARKSLSERIVEQILKSDEYKSSEKIMVYEAVKGEVSLESLKDKALADGKKLIYPKCVSKEEMVALCPLSNFDLLKDITRTSDNMPNTDKECPAKEQCNVHEQGRTAPVYKYSDCFEKGYCGIPEPIESKCALVKPEEIELVICPCTSFDENCNRMGMGGGFYDRYLTKCINAKICAVAFEVQKSIMIPTEGWDIPMDAIFTEDNKFIRNGYKTQFK